MYVNVIIIPYRDRKAHLDIFIGEALPLFEKYLSPFKVVVVEQEKGKQFNRGKLLNIGFTEYKHKTEYFFTHDVDILPKESCAKDIYTKTGFDVLRIFTGNPQSLGGVCKFEHDSVFIVNGLPNNIWGWGIEDRAFFYRYSILERTISPNLTRRNNHKLLSHPTNILTYHGDKKKINDLEEKMFKSPDPEEQIAHIMQSGLNNLEYTVVEREDISNNVERIKVII